MEPSSPEAFLAVQPKIQPTRRPGGLYGRIIAKKTPGNLFSFKRLPLDPVKVGVDTSGKSGQFMLDTALVGNSNAGHSFEDGPRGNGVIDPVRRPPATVAVDECGGTLAAQLHEQAPHLAGREAEVGSRLLERQLADKDVSQDGEALLRTGVQGDRLPRCHGLEGDKVAVRLRRTESLAVHKAARPILTSLHTSAYPRLPHRVFRHGAHRLA